MAILNKKKLTWVLLIFIGTFRCFYDLLFFPEQMNYFSWISPRPNVFSGLNYAEKKILTLTFSDETQLSFNYLSPEQWPLKANLLISYNTLIHALDRPYKINADLWQTIIRKNFCSEYKYKILKEFISEKNIKKIKLTVFTPQEKIKTVRELDCIN